MSIDVAAEIARRLDELRARPALLARYDVDRSGHLDADEWALVERIVAVEVAHGVRREEGVVADAVAPDGLLEERYEITGLLGVGGQGRTWLANDLRDDRTVAVKELAIGQALDWKSVELFERETEVLRNLDHPAIPHYVDAFHRESDGEVRFFLVQDFVEGTPLDADIDGRHWKEDDLLGLLRDALGILSYLHGLSPPVVHRDIKPSNLIQRPDGSLALIDFGAVSTVSPDLTGGSTIVGTSGYMPIEQFMGRAEPRTDLYALAATVVHLLTRVHPADLPVERSRIQFEGRARISDGFVELLAELLAPIAQDRPESAQAVIERIDELRAPPEPIEPTRALVRKGPAPLAKRPDVTAPVSTRSALRAAPYGLVTLGIFVFGIQLLGFACTQCGGHEAAMQAINECPTATAALGDNIRHSPIGWSCGSYEGSGCGGSRSAYSDATIPVRGDERRARFRYQASLRHGVWTLSSASFRFDGWWWDVAPCQPGAAGDSISCDGTRCETVSPLPDDLDVWTLWDPCDGGPFTYRAEIDFESCCDHVRVGPLSHTGEQAVVEGMALGPTRVSIRTDGSVESGGVRSLVATCNADLPEPVGTICTGMECRGKSSPDGAGVRELLVWDPCDGRPFTFSGEIDFAPCCDELVVDGVVYVGEEARVTGGSVGPAQVFVRTDGRAGSAGIRHLVATCEPMVRGELLDCEGDRCRTVNPLPDDAAESVVWDPCDGGAFRYRGRIQTEDGYDFIRIDGRPYSGAGPVRGSVDGPVRVEVETDGSLPSRGIRRLRATCE